MLIESIRRRRSLDAMICLGFAVCGAIAFGAPAEGAARFHQAIQPVLSQFCYDCHGDGMQKGGMSLDTFESDEVMLKSRELWWNVLKYLRAGLMPPQKKKARPSDEQRHQIENWIKRDVFGCDPANPDPGRVTIRRLNRVEYRNTIRDLMGVNFKTEEEFPPDDSGYGFDNIGDVLATSPLLLEKYMQAAEWIVAEAVPRVALVLPEKTIPGSSFRGGPGEPNGERMSFYKEAKVTNVLHAPQAGAYHLRLHAEVAGSFDFDPGRCRTVFSMDGQERLSQEFGWQNHKQFHFEFDEKWTAGDHALIAELHPLTPTDQKRNPLDFKIISVEVQGPLEKKFWTRSKNYERFFFKGEPRGSEAERRQYAREILSHFTTKAFRRPADARALERLARIAEMVERQPEKRFEDGLAQAMVAVLSSPRFLFRVEAPESTPAAGAYPLVDEYSLASRLSYFLWSATPDDELLSLAQRGELRRHLSRQIERMLADSRSEALIENFTGQWLQVRDVEGIAINERAVLAREEHGVTNQASALALKRQRPFGRPRLELTRELRQAMGKETEMCFGRVLRENRSVLELIDGDYTYLNEKLARHYGITNVQGSAMRLVVLPKDSPRGGLLGQGSILLVTSNPTRTSPVKRGQFILENILGMPAAPPPPDVPQLEDSAKQFKDREPTLREVLAVHREKPLCASCHGRMDPLGLALENFNALGLWREREFDQPVNTSGKLITGEEFHDIRELKRILKEKHAVDFYRCLTEKLLAYALGRGLEYYDVETVDQIVARLEREQGRFSALLSGIIQSAPFQKQRNFSSTVAVAKPQPNAVALNANHSQR